MITRKHVKEELKDKEGDAKVALSLATLWSAYLQLDELVTSCTDAAVKAVEGPSDEKKKNNGSD